MAIEQSTFVREILMVRPAVSDPWAFHQKKITVTSGAPFPIADQYGEAEALNTADIGAVLDHVFVDMSNERNAAVAAKTAADEIAAARLAERNDAIAAKDQAAAALAAAQARIAELQAIIDGAIAQP